VRAEDFHPGFPGELIQIGSASGTEALAFLPNPLPPRIELSMSLATQAERSAIALGNLSGLGILLPNPYLLVRPFVRREALASSRIEGTQADFAQLALIEAEPGGGADNADIQEVVNYMSALNAGWQQPQERKLSTGLAKDLHRLLMHGVRGQDKGPCELRKRQVMIGSRGQRLHEARFVPPPSLEVRSLLDDLFDFADSETTFPNLVRIAFIHYQFETIHPFEDGNGRLGRLLIPLLLRQWSLLEYPLLYLSEFFERYRDEYIDGLYRVSTRGDWENWTQFVLRGIEVQSREAIIVGKKLIELREELRQLYATHRSPNILAIIDRLFERPTITFNEAAKITGTTPKSGRLLVRQLEEDGVLEEVTGQNRGMIFVARNIMAALTSTADLEAA
jgi:Fic family protein